MKILNKYKHLLSKKLKDLYVESKSYGLFLGSLYFVFIIFIWLLLPIYILYFITALVANLFVGLVAFLLIIYPLIILGIIIFLIIHISSKYKK